MDSNRNDIAQKGANRGNARLQILSVVTFTLLGTFCLHCLDRVSLLQKDIRVLTESVEHLEEYYNHAVPVFNREKFVLEGDFIPIVTYVFNRSGDFAQTIEALSKVKGIERTILVVSHDGLNPEMLRIARGVSFCQVKQLIHPTPPIKRGNPVALREHWWWLQRKLWGDLFSDHEGDICFIEEDHEVSPDFYETIKVLSAMKKKGVVEGCATVAAGSYNTDPSMKASSFSTFPGFHNTGYAFNRSVWNAITANEEAFIKGDRNGDWDSCLVDGLMKPGIIGDKQITPTVSRVVNIGKVGLHSDQVYATLHMEGRHPHTTDPNPDWSDLELFEMNNDGSPYQVERHGPPSRKSLCKGDGCYL